MTHYSKESEIKKGPPGKPAIRHFPEVPGAYRVTVEGSPVGK